MNNTNLALGELTAFTKTAGQQVTSMFGVAIALTPQVAEKIVNFWSFPWMDNSNTKMQDEFRTMFTNMKETPEYGPHMLSDFSDQLAAYVTSVMGYVNISSPAFSMTDKLGHVQDMFIRIVRPMARVKSRSKEFVYDVVQMILDYARSRLKDEAQPYMDKVQSYGTIGFVAIGMIGIYLISQ